MERLIKMTAIPLFLVGFLLIYASISVFNSTNDFKKIAVPVTAVISDISSHFDGSGDRVYSVYVDYKYNNESYKHVYINTYNSNMFVGKKIKIHVNTIFPSEAKHISYIFVFFLSGMAIILMLSGLGIFFMNHGIQNSEEI